MKLLAIARFVRQHWRGILLATIAAAVVANTLAIDADRDRQRELANARGAVLEQSVAAAGAANGWPATMRLKAEQLPLQIQLYGNALREIRTKTAAARAADLGRARDVEGRDLAIMKEQQDALSKKLAAELRRADDYARRLRRQQSPAGSNSGGGRAADLPAAADAAGDPARAGNPALLDDDVRICTRNTVIAEGWAEFWARVFAEPR
ncbi:hypothetical protein M9978_02270 [Sphingomonas sp. MG17]|uniref:Uncharacterized protein n=1 Tax=Sphingomonas tagetis TaxID=2949092 RepID=A0A9X2HDR0_9SPHN|nr:hypothetical protein [Sphingomonas tagetis]MCP3729241.1 hypothetical protein [Sphingomonas tagetis]